MKQQGCPQCGSDQLTYATEVTHYYPYALTRNGTRVFTPDYQLSDVDTALPRLICHGECDGEVVLPDDFDFEIDGITAYEQAG